MIDVYLDENAPEKIIRVDYIPPVRSWDEYHAAINRSFQITRSVAPSPVYIIHNPGETQMPPGNALAHLLEASRDAPPNITAVYMIVEDIMARRLVEIARRIFGNINIIDKYHFVDSVKTAYELITVRNRG